MPEQIVRLLPKADPQIEAFGAKITSAMPSKADIKLILAKGAALDPRRTSCFFANSRMPQEYLRELSSEV